MWVDGCLLGNCVAVNSCSEPAPQWTVAGAASRNARIARSAARQVARYREIQIPFAAFLALRQIAEARIERLGRRFRDSGRMTG